MSAELSQTKENSIAPQQHLLTDNYHLQLECQKVLNLSTAYQRVEGAGAAVKDIASGGVHQVTHHPLKLATQAAVGAGLSVAAKLLPREPVAFVGFFMGAAALAELSVKSRDWSHALGVLNGTETATAQSTKMAHAQLRNLGAGMADLTAATLAGGLTFKGLAGLEARAAIKNEAFKPFTTAANPHQSRFAFKDDSHYPGVTRTQQAPYTPARYYAPDSDVTRLWGLDTPAQKTHVDITQIWKSESAGSAGR